MMDETPFSKPQIAIFDAQSGDLQMIAPNDFALPHGDVGWSPLPTAYSDETHSWDPVSRLMADDLQKVEDQLIRALKIRAEALKATAITDGIGKTREYDDKGAEVASSAAMADADVDALTDEQAMTSFPAAATERARTGEDLSVILARYREAAARSLREIRRYAAIEQHHVALIRQAPTATDKRRAAAVDWEWRPE